MKSDLLYADHDFGIEEIIKVKISEVEAMCPCSFDRPCIEEACFEELSLTKFALKELLQKVIECPGIFQDVVVEDFAIKMERYARENPKASYPFLVACEAAQSILDTIDEYGYG